jgi:hypothetical protein
MRRLSARRMLSDILRENQSMSALELAEGLDTAAHTLKLIQN